MAKIGIIAALDCEIEQFIVDFHASKTENEHIYKGEYAGHEIYLTLCGVGKVNAAICAQRMLDFAPLDALINSGVAGGVGKTLNVCDLVVSSSLTYHDFYPLNVLDKYAPGCSVFTADTHLVALAEGAADKLSQTETGFHHETGVIVTGDRFVEDGAYKETLRQDFDALCTEMEGAAIAHVAIIGKVPFVVIRAISDNADESADMSFDAMAAIAAKRAVFVVKEMIAAF